MKYRNKVQIIGHLLEQFTNGSLNKTRIMYSCYLSYQQLTSYLQICTSNHLLTETKSGEYLITEKAKSFLDAYHKLNAVLPMEALNHA